MNSNGLREFVIIIAIALIGGFVGLYLMTGLQKFATDHPKPTRCACHFETGLIIEDNCK